MIGRDGRRGRGGRLATGRRGADSWALTWRARSCRRSGPASIRVSTCAPRSMASSIGCSRRGRSPILSLAPELPGALPLIAEVAARGVVVSAAHTDATAEQARAGFDAGIRATTHTWNGMRPLGHRDPGIVGAALVRSGISIGLVGDGVHVAPEVMALTWRAAGDRVCLTTDAVAAAGAPDGTYSIGEVVIERRDGRVLRPRRTRRRRHHPVARGGPDRRRVRCPGAGRARGGHDEPRDHARSDRRGEASPRRARRPRHPRRRPCPPVRPDGWPGDRPGPHRRLHLGGGAPGTRPDHRVAIRQPWDERHPTLVAPWSRRLSSRRSGSGCRQGWIRNRWCCQEGGVGSSGSLSLSS